MSELEKINLYDIELRESVDKNGEENGMYGGLIHGNAHYIAEAGPILDFFHSYDPKVGWARAPPFEAYRLCQYDAETMTAYVRPVTDETLLHTLGQKFSNQLSPGMRLMNILAKAEEDTQRRCDKIHGIQNITDLLDE